MDNNARNSVEPVPVPQKLLDFIRQGNTFLVAGHKEPDGDCVGSQLALASALGRLGKKAIPCSAGPFKRTEIMSYAPRFTEKPAEADREGARVIIVDCSSGDRTGDLEPFLNGLPTAVIDHHATGADSAPLSGDVRFLDTAAPSVTFMILALIEALGLVPNKEEAHLLLFGLCTDTGFFRHVDSRGAETFSRASRLIAAGANPKTVFQAIHGGKNLDSRVLMGLVLARAQAYFDGRLLLSSEEYEETQRFGKEGRDSDSLYQLLQAVEGGEAIAIIRQETPERCTVGLRSRDAVDVAAIAAQFGGGGHKNAAGLSTNGTIEELKPKILEAFGKIFK
jgi:phosphoesterase RecJ-like protein